METKEFSAAVSVIIPVHNGGSSFEKCIDSVKKALGPSDEMVVVADGNSDGSWRIAEKYGAVIVSLSNQGGPAKARNNGALKAMGDILFFTDADVVIPPDTLLRIKGAFEKDKTLSALFGSYDDEPSEPDLLSQYRNLMHHYVHQRSEEKAASFWTGCGAIRRKVFLEVGGFNEAYRFPSIEDIELGNRLRKAGFHIRLVKELQVKHLKQWKFLTMLKADFFFRALPWTNLILREKLSVNDLNLKWHAKLSTLSVFFILIFGVSGLFFSFFILFPPFFLSVSFLSEHRFLSLFKNQTRSPFYT